MDKQTDHNAVAELEQPNGSVAPSAQHEAPPAGSAISITRSPDDNSLTTILLPPPRLRRWKKATTCFIVVLWMMLMPIIGGWYMIGAGLPESYTHAEGPGLFYYGLMGVSFAFIAGIFVFAALVFLADGLHALIGRDRLIINAETIRWHRTVYGRRILLGSHEFHLDEIESVLRHEQAGGGGGVRVKSPHDEQQLGEHLTAEEQLWLVDTLTRAIPRR